MDDPVQEFQNEADQAVVDCLRNQVILREILRHFSSTELFQLSLVNKLWNYEARSVMRERRNVVAKMNKPDLCVQAGAFGSALKSMNVVFFSEIIIRFPHDFDHDDACGCADGLCRIRPDSFSRKLSLRAADIVVRGPWWSYPNCPAVQLAKIVLRQSSGSLEDLWLEVDLRQEDFIRQVFQEQDCNFPRLTCLNLPHELDEVLGSDYANFIKLLVSRAPNLEELYLEELDQSTENALEGRREALIVMGAHVSAPFDGIPENFMSAVRLETADLFYTGPEFNFERYNRVAPVLLKATYRTLYSLDICPLLLPSLMSYGVRLRGVTEFTMDIHFSELALTQPWVLGILKNFDFTRILPNLKTVTMNRGDIVPGPLPDEMIRMLEDVEAALMEPQLDRAENIQELILHDRLYEDAPELWAHTFPSVRKLRLGADDENALSEGFPIISIWEHWADVEELEVSLRDMRGIYPTADSAFCGIFPEECAELRDKDEEYLKCVNIVPVMPSITCFKNLKTLTLDYYSDEFADELAQPELFKLTRLIAFARCRPSVTIILKTGWTAIYEALRHMEPYVSVILTE